MDNSATATATSSEQQNPALSPPNERIFQTYGDLTDPNSALSKS